MILICMRNKNPVQSGNPLIFQIRKDLTDCCIFLITAATIKQEILSSGHFKYTTVPLPDVQTSDRQSITGMISEKADRQYHKHTGYHIPHSFSPSHP